MENWGKVFSFFGGGVFLIVVGLTLAAARDAGGVENFTPAPWVAPTIGISILVGLFGWALERGGAETKAPDEHNES